MILCVESSVVTAPGIYTMPAESYHRDPWDTPSLSASLMRKLIEDSPLHAWASHPRLNPGAGADDESSHAMDVGSVVHKLALDEGDEIAVLPYADFRKNEAKEARQRARHENKLPCLAHQYEAAVIVAKPMREALAEVVGMPVADCLREKVIAWEFNGVKCRARVDLVTPDGLIIADVKTTKRSVSPRACEYRIYDGLYHVQAKHYIDGMDIVDPDNAGRRRFVFLFAEQSSPYAVSPPMEVSEAGLTLAEEQISHAMHLWAECLESGKWPSYPTELCYANPPLYMLSRHEERMAQEQGKVSRRDTHDHIRDLEFLYQKRRELEEAA